MLYNLQLENVLNRDEKAVEPLIVQKANQFFLNTLLTKKAIVSNGSLSFLLLAFGFLVLYDNNIVKHNTIAARTLYIQ
jgi:hypothetical protein